MKPTTWILQLSLLALEALSLRQRPIGISNEFDACAKIADKSVVSYDEALNCYRMFPLQSNVMEGTLSTLRKLIPLYAFLDISKSSPEIQIPLKVDLKAELDRISYKRYSDELSFQLDLMHLFHRLNDGHTGYTSYCFTSFIFRQPFPIVTTLEPFGGQKFTVLPYFSLADGLEEAWEKLGIKVKEYAGADVLLINGMPPLDFFTHYANTVIGASKDINSRINLALARVIQRDGRWGIANGGFASTTDVPKRGSITYTFKIKDKGVRTISVPYLVSNPQGYDDSEEFYKLYCSKKDFRVKTISPSYFPLLPELKVMHIPQITQEKIDIDLKKISHNNLYDDNPLDNPLTKGQVIQTWKLTNKTGVMTITSFIANSQEQFIREAANGFRAFKREGIDRLILDVSNNGGGVICWGYYILDYLFPKSSKKYFDTDMRLSNLMLNLIDRDNREDGFFNFKYWAKPNGREFNSTEEFIGNNKYFRGNTDSHYTSLFDDYCGNNPLHIKLQDLDNGQPPFPKSNLAVITNSICYSTCSLLVNGLQELHSVTTYAMGGSRYSLATAASIQGGTVYNFDALLSDLRELNLLNYPDGPKEFPTEAGFSFTIREAYSTIQLPGDDRNRLFSLRPLEFKFTKATYHRPYPGPYTILSPFDLWRQIDEDFFHHQ